jgi:hypothetical protein
MFWFADHETEIFESLYIYRCILTTHQSEYELELSLFPSDPAQLFLNTLFLSSSKCRLKFMLKMIQLYALASFAVFLLYILIHKFPLSITLPTRRDRNVKQTASLEVPKSQKLATKLEELAKSYRNLYHKTQNLERFPEILPEARQTLQSLLDQGLLMAKYKPQPRTILDIHEFDKVQLQAFLKAEEAEVLREFEEYIQKRKDGAGPDHFGSFEEARQFLKRGARWNYADGAWLSRTHQITTPFPLRKVMKGIWQIYSEELGDGDISKNHVFLYRQLLQSVGVELLDPDSPDFIHPDHGLNDEPGWRYAVTQMLLSLFPNDFLPEILGFTLHYESPPLSGYKTAKELPEFGISPYYYTLHISIDNSDSGHSAMALGSIADFMQVVQETGLMDHRSAWKRIQAGYLLGQSLDYDETLHHYEEKLVDFLFKKAELARKIHCTSRASLGGRSLSTWLPRRPNDGCERKQDPGRDIHAGKDGFLAALADSKPWVYRGDSGKSRLMQELTWKGRMFGAFTNYEVRLLRTWIDSLRSKDAGPEEVYWDRVGGYETVQKKFSPPRHDVAVTHPVFPPMEVWAPSTEHEFAPREPLQLRKASLRLDTLLPLWFVHPCLLENMINLPYRTIQPVYSHCLQLLRAEKGFSLEGSGISCMDEQLRPSYSPDLITLGLEMIRRHNLPEPTSLGDVLPHAGDDGGVSDTVSFCLSLLSWSQRPMRNGAFLLGLSRAFLDLEVWVSCSDELLSGKQKYALAQIVKRKMTGFEACLAELQGDIKRCQEFIGGYDCGRTQLEKLLS